MLRKRNRLYLLFVIIGVVIRLAFVLAANSQQPTFLSGGSDAPVYVLLAQNILAGRGFTYTGQPSAFRPPGYPLLPAGSQVLLAATTLPRFAFFSSGSAYSQYFFAPGFRPAFPDRMHNARQ
jgi:hypothetical protein